MLCKDIWELTKQWPSECWVQVLNTFANILRLQASGQESERDAVSCTDRLGSAALMSNIIGDSPAAHP